MSKELVKYLTIKLDKKTKEPIGFLWQGLVSQIKSQIKALVALKGFYPETYLFADDNIRRIKEALNEESEEK